MSKSRIRLALFPLVSAVCTFLACAFAACAPLTASAEVVYLKNGTLLEGSVVGGDSREIIVDTSMGTVQVPRYNIERIVYAETRTPGLRERTAELAGDFSTGTDQWYDDQEKIGTGLSPENPGDSGGDRAGTAQLYETTLQLMVLNRSFLRPEERAFMQELAGAVPLEKRLGMYTAGLRRDRSMAGGLNFLVPSLGSWAQGDVGGAITQDLFLGAGVFLVVNPLDWKAGDDDLVYTGIGVGLLAFQYLYGLVRPSQFDASYNGKLADSLDLEEGILDSYGRGRMYDFNAAYGASDALLDAAIDIQLVKLRY